MKLRAHPVKTGQARQGLPGDVDIIAGSAFLPAYPVNPGRGIQPTCPWRNRMDSIVLSSIPFQLDTAALRKKLHIKEGSHHAEELDHLIQGAHTVGKPKVLYKEAFIESRTDETVTLDGITFKSRVLRVNLENIYRVFPYVITCGLELEEWSKKDCRFPSRVLGGGD